MNLVGEQSARQEGGPFDLAELLHPEISCRSTFAINESANLKLAQSRRD
jgi:hypothetical protein